MPALLMIKIFKDKLKKLKVNKLMQAIIFLTIVYFWYLVTTIDGTILNYSY